MGQIPVPDREIDRFVRKLSKRGRLTLEAWLLKVLLRATAGMQHELDHKTLLKRLARVSEQMRETYLSSHYDIDVKAVNEFADKLNDMQVSNFDTHLANLRKILPKIFPKDDAPVQIFLGEGARPNVNWYGGEIPDTADAAAVFGATSSLQRVLYTFVAMTDGRAGAAVIDALLRGFTDGPHGATGGPKQSNIVAMMRVGLPINPTHMRGMLPLDPQHIHDIAHVPVLLHGISLADRKPEEAQQILAGARNLLASEMCGLIELALAIAIRKQDGAAKIQESIITADSAVKALTRMSGEQCAGCAVKCAMNPILIGLYRTLGATNRKNAQIIADPSHFAIARDRFAQAEALLAKTTPKDVRSELLFSFAYLMFEMATIKREPSTFDCDLLRQALEKFGFAADARTDWSAPQLRIGIIKAVMGEIDDAGTYFYNSMSKSASEYHIDALLTRLLGRLAWLSIKGCTPEECVALETDMHALFKDTFLPSGPRECHAYDAKVLFDGAIAARVRDPVLKRCWQVFVDSGEWRHSTDLATQRSKYQESRNKFPLAGRRRSIPGRRPMRPEA